ncbi:Inner membrane protein YbjJ [Dyadobacter sp. CECT 9275]|uniref:Inner membrane protein YbjJ n=1 Tax=Dyadobacter helix TaxID=2822344 RepID=A0A916JAB4_9BACT|nr:MFS transporter [Dyadobacter sp. CECT 9275]CAG4999056.1 Inner membrane protein YbjJ [Dyadobacter sp. CECT 9275]
MPANNSISASPVIKSARTATLLIFLVCGIGISSWAPMVPFVKTNLGLSEANLGIVLLSLGAGAILTMPFTSLFINQYGSRKVSLVAAVVIALMLPLLLIAGSAFSLATALFVFGAAIGTIDVAMNAHAIVVQNSYGRPIMSAFHGMFSLGGLVGSIGLGFLIKYGLSPTVAAISISVLLLLIAITQYSRLLPHTKESRVDTFKFTLPTGPVLRLGLMCFVLFLAEGALLDWSAVFLQFSRGFDPSLSGIGFASFSVAMAAMRLTGDKIVHRLGTRKVVVLGTLMAAAGYFMAVLLPYSYAALIGFTFIGLGAANAVPVFFTAAGRISGIPAAVALPAVTTLGYAGQLAGPALIGFIAEFSSLPVALGFVGILLLLVSISYSAQPE